MGGRGAEHIEHAQMGVFDMFEGWKRQVGWGWGVNRWVEEVPNTLNTPRQACSTCLRGDVRWERQVG